MIEGFRGDDFQICPSCGHRADLVDDSLEATDSGGEMLRLLCANCGNEGEVRRQFIDTEPVRWIRGWGALDVGLPSYLEGLTIRVGRNVMGYFVRLDGELEKVLGAITPEARKHVRVLLGEHIEA